MLAEKRKRVLSVVMSLMMVLSIRIPSGVYGAEQQSRVHIHGQAGFCSDGYYYTGNCRLEKVQETDTSQETTDVQPGIEKPDDSQPQDVTESDTKTDDRQTEEKADEQTDVTKPDDSQPQAECPEKEDGSNFSSEAITAPAQTTDVSENQADLSQQRKDEETSDQAAETLEKQKDLLQQSDPVNVLAQPAGVLAKPVGADSQVDTVNSKNQKEEKGTNQEKEKSDDTKGVYECERYPYFTVTFVDKQEKNEQAEVNVVPKLSKKFPLIVPDFKDKNGNSVESWTDQRGKPVELQGIDTNQTVYAKWAEQNQLPTTSNINPLKLENLYKWNKDSNESSANIQVFYYQNESMQKWESGIELNLPRQAFPLFFVKVTPGYEIKATNGLEIKDIDELKGNHLIIGRSLGKSLKETPQYASDLFKGPICLYKTAKGKLISDFALSLPALIPGSLNHFYSLDGTDKIDASQIQLSDYQNFFYWSPWLYTDQAKDRTIHLTAIKEPVLTYYTDIPVHPEIIFKKEFYRKGTKVQLKFDGIDKPGYEFLGWSEDSKAKTPEYTKEQSEIVMDGDKTLYAVWNKISETKDTDAKFFIRLDGSVPLEDGNEQHAHGEYTEGLSGTVDGTACWTKYNGVIDEKTGRIDGTKVEEAFASILPHIKTQPSDLQIEKMLEKDENAKSHNLTFDPDKQRVIWYVVKKVENDADLWHVDGVICSKSAHVMLQYHENAGKDKVHGIPDMKLYEENADAPIIFKDITRDGYEFLGWSLKPNATPKNMEFPISGKQTTICMDKEKHLYAVWKEDASPTPEDAYTIFYNANVADDIQVSNMPPNKTNLKKNSPQDLSEQLPTRPEEDSCTWECKGWSLSDGKDGKVQVQTTHVKLKGTDVTVYAIWKPIPKVQYTVTVHYYKWNEDPKHLYGLDDQLANPLTATDYCGQPYKVNIKDTSQKEIDGYEHYKTEGDLEGTLAKDVDIRVFYKQQIAPPKPPAPPAAQYTVHYDANLPQDVLMPEEWEKTWPKDAKTEPNESYPLSTDHPTQLDEKSCTYEFKGWSLSKTGDSSVSEIPITDHDVTVYAIWKSIPNEDPSGGGTDPGQQGGGTDPGDQGGGQTGDVPSGGDTHHRDHHDRDNNGSGSVTIPDSEVPLASQPVNPPEVIIPDQPIPLAANPGEETAADNTGVPLAGVDKLPKTGGIGAGLVTGMGVLLIALGLLLKRKDRKADQ